MKSLAIVGMLVSSSALLAACTHQSATTSVQETTQTAVTEAEAELDQLTEGEFILDPVNNSGQMGEVAIRATEDGKTEIILTMQGGTYTQPQPAHIHEGECPGVGKIAYTLNPVQEGFSRTILNIDRDELENRQLAINVHESSAKVETYTACGELE